MAAQDLRSEIEQILRRAQADLLDLGRSCALIGGLAVSARCEPRFTRDVDLAVCLDSDAEAEALIRDFQGRGYQIEMVLEQETTERLATVRLRPTDAQYGVILDLLFASSGIEPEIVASAEVIEIFPGIEIPVARTGDLLALKILARDDERRPQDNLDIRALLAVADEEELERARQSLALIQERRFHRNRDLLAALAALSK